MQDFAATIGSLFSNMYESSPVLFGSKYPVFFFQLLVLIVIFDLIIFGWRPLIRKFLPDYYQRIDYIFNQVVNGIAFVVLISVTFYLGGELSEVWGSFLGISGVIWLTLGIIAAIFLARFATTRSFSGTSPRTPVKK